MRKSLLIILSYFILFSYAQAQNRNYLDFLQKLESPDGESIFALYHGIAGYSDHEYHVFKFPKEMDPEKLLIPRSYWSHKADEEARKWARYSLFFNWSEDASHRRNPEIKIFKNKYLVLIRGGLYHSLYDIEADNTIVNFRSPFHKYLRSEEYKSLEPKPTFSQRKKLLEDWKKQNLHNPISEIVDNE